MTEEKPIIGAIAQILDSYTIVLNRGSRDGVKRDMRFAIYYVSADEIIDPETNEPLGQVELFKGYGRVFSVQEKLSVLKSDRYSTGIWATLAALKSQGHDTLPFDNPRVGDKAKYIPEQKNVIAPANS